MALTVLDGYEVLLNPEVPNPPGWRWVNARTVEVHPAYWQALEQVHAGLEQLLQVALAARQLQLAAEQFQAALVNFVAAATGPAAAPGSPADRSPGG